MLKKSILIIVLFLFSTISFAQDKWIYVQSDDGEFSIEVPKNYSYFYDENGIRKFNIKLSQMSVLNSYRKNTLLSFERYKVGKINNAESVETKDKAVENPLTERVLKEIEDEIPLYANNPKKQMSLIEKDGNKIDQIIRKNKDQTTIRQYFFSNDFIYILTASSRNGETAEMKRFFDSLKFSPNFKVQSVKNAKLFSKLKQTKIEIKDSSEKENSVTKFEVNSVKKDVITFLLVVSPGIPHTLESLNKFGVMKLEITFSKSGQVTKINVLNSISKDLIQNTILTALRIKFLPQEKNGKPVTVTKIIEYYF